MNHDIAHCKGSHCTLRNSCLRFLAHRDLQLHRNRFLQDRANYILPSQCVSNDLYWPSNNPEQ